MSGQTFQFGTSRFVRAHRALSAHKAWAVGANAVIQSFHFAERAGRIAAVRALKGHPLDLRGLNGGRPAERRTMIRSAGRALSAKDDRKVSGGVFSEGAKAGLSASARVERSERAAR